MTLFLSLLAGLLGLGLGETAWAISLQKSDLYWPAWPHGAFLAAGAGLGLAWALGQSLAWRLAFGWDRIWGLRIGAFSLFPALLGFSWPLLLRATLPPPHHFPLRNLELLLAAQMLLPLFLSVWLGSLGLALGRAMDSLSDRSLALRLGGLALAAYVLSGAWVGQWNSSGDAPHYVLMAHSVLHDQDLDLDNNYDDEHWRLFYDRPMLERQLPDQPDGRQMPEHKVGLSLLMLPGYALLGMSGARWVLGLMAAAGASLFFLFCLQTGFSRRLSLWGWLVFSFSAPWLTHSQLGLAELVGGFLVLLAFAAWRGILPRWVAPLACAYLVWVSVRYYPLALSMACVDSWGRRKEGWLRAALPLAWVALALALGLAHNQSMYGHFSPAVTYVQRGQPWDVILKPLNALRYASGLMIDQEYGWLPYVPVFSLGSTLR